MAGIFFKVFEDRSARALDNCGYVAIREAAEKKFEPFVLRKECHCGAPVVVAVFKHIHKKARIFSDDATHIFRIGSYIKLCAFSCLEFFKKALQEQNVCALRDSFLYEFLLLQGRGEIEELFLVIKKEIRLFFKHIPRDAAGFFRVYRLAPLFFLDHSKITYEVRIFGYKKSSFPDISNAGKKIIERNDIFFCRIVKTTEPRPRGFRGNKTGYCLLVC